MDKILKYQPPTLEEFLEAEVKELPWLIRGFVPASAITILSGQQKRAFKTWMSNAIAATICSGKPWDRLVPEQTGPVLHIQMEGTQVGNRELIRAIHKKVGTNKEDRTERYRYIFRENVKLDNPDWKEALLRLVDEYKPILVIMDCWVYLHTADENKVNEVKPVFDTIVEIRNRGITCLIVAHLNSQGEEPKADIDNQVRGRGVLVNAYDAHLALRRYSMDEPHIQLTTRFRDLGGEDHYLVKWDIKAEQETVYDVALTIRDATDEKEESQLEQKVNMLLSGMEYSITQLKGAWQCSDKSAKDYIRDGIQGGWIEQVGSKFKRTEKRRKSG